MADAKIITYGAQISAGSTAIPDNHATALDIEGVDGKDYINISTVDGSEVLTLKAGGASNERVQVDADGNVSGASGQYRLQTGTISATAPTYGFNGDNDTGIGRGAEEAQPTSFRLLRVVLKGFGLKRLVALRGL